MSTFDDTYYDKGARKNEKTEKIDPGARDYHGFLATTLFLLSHIVPASERFELVLDGKAVLDKETGLIWEQSPDATKRTWASACAYCLNKEVGGRKGWRLPTQEELSSLVDTNESDPTLPSGHSLSNVQSANYWSSTSSPNDAWGVSFSTGIVSPIVRSITNYVWCVRGGK